MILRPPSIRDQAILPEDSFPSRRRRTAPDRCPLEFLLNPYRFGGGGGGSGLIDSYTTNLWGAYGLQLLRSNFLGSAIRVRRSSDNTEQDIGFTGTALNTTALASFVGANNGFITKWYDQSGGSNDLVQATSGAQPMIVDTGAYLGEITLDGVDDYLNTTNNSGTPTAFTMHFAGRHRTMDISDRTTLVHASGAEVYNHPGNYNSNYGAAMRGSAGALATADEQQASDESALTFQFDRTQGSGILQNRVWANGVSKTMTFGGGTVMTGSFTAGAWTVGYNGTSRFAHLACKTLLIYETAQNSTDIGSIAALIKPVPAVNTLDSYTTSLWGLYSLRHLRTAYAGSCIRVRRSSDNAEQDIGFTVAGFLDVASMLTFVGANSGFIRTWYDQSAAGNNIGQSTAANQARIVNAGAVDLGVVFDGSNDYLISVNNSGTPSAFTTYFRGTATSAGTVLVHLEHNSADTGNNVASYRGTASVTYLNVAEATISRAAVTFNTIPAGQIVTSVTDKTLVGATNIDKMYSGGIVLPGTSVNNTAVATTTYLAKQWSVGSRNGTLAWAGYLHTLAIYETAHAAATIERVSRAIG
jgi:hypothetical protein